MAAAWRLAMASPRLVECNLCGWQGQRLMSDGWHAHSVCPGCASSVRHRLLAAALTTEPWSAIADGRSVLHFSPEIMLRDWFRRRARTYTTADYFNPRHDVRLDICNMTSVEDGSFELVVACDVLEHVPDDRRAMRELHRVVRPGGYAILTVPQKDFLQHTLEDPTVADPQTRERLFGQHDHLRMYGADFADRLRDAGFVVSTVDEGHFTPVHVSKHVLFPPVLSTRPNATNYRKVFFAHRAR